MTELTVRQMAADAWKNSDAHGFHNDGSTVVEKLMLVVSEAAEALESIRNGEENLGALKYSTTPLGFREKPIGFMSELADIVIRVGDLAGIVGGDLAVAIEAKMAYNRTRPFRHGKRL